MSEVKRQTGSAGKIVTLDKIQLCKQILQNQRLGEMIIHTGGDASVPIHLHGPGVPAGHLAREGPAHGPHVKAW